MADGRGKNTQLPLADLLRQSVYSRLAGYEDLNDAARLSQDPTFRLIGSRKVWERGAALTSRLQSFETALLTQTDNLAGHDPCITHPIESMRNLTEKVKTEIPVKCSSYKSRPGSSWDGWRSAP